jgi:uridine kinase
LSTVIAFVGASGSGKTQLVEALTMADGSRCPAVMRVDDYYRDLSHLDFASRETINFDHPDAIEFNRLAADLGQLKSGVSVHAPVYDFTQHTRSNVTQIIESAELVILEGVLAMAEVATRALIDRLVFVDTPLDTCLSRRITRDAHERGRTEASVRDFWETRAAPMFEHHVRPWQAQADLTLRGDGDFTTELSRARTWLHAL